MNKRIYLDNAATTALDHGVLKAMLPYLGDKFGNASAVYSYGREARVAIEEARKSIADLLGTKPSTIIFTSGGTESNNMAIGAAVRDLGCTHIITSPIEHHAVSHTIDFFSQHSTVTRTFVALDEEGRVDYRDLERQLREQYIQLKRCLVSLMHANNETGVLTDIKRVGELCRKYDAIFHTDAVQTVGHYQIDLKRLYVQFLSASSHKFHGPKGSGILYVNEQARINPLIHGGAQERNLRAGTENVAGIVGLAEALRIATTHLQKDSQRITWLKNYLTSQLKNTVEGISFNSTGDSLYTIVSANFPRTPGTESMVFQLDQHDICVSGGSACSAGGPSHVMAALGKDEKFVTVRFSFSRDNDTEEIVHVVDIIKDIVTKKELVP